MELLSLAIIGGIYFLPTIVAMSRSKKNSGAIFLVNLLLGWTVIGWIVALVWSLMYEEPAQRASPTVSTKIQKRYKCPNCGAEGIDRNDRFCKSCGIEFEED